MKKLRIKIIVLLILFLIFYKSLYSQNNQDNIIQICIVRNEREEGITKLEELSDKKIAYDPRYETVINALLWSCKNLGIFGVDIPPPQFSTVFNSKSDKDKIKIAKDLIREKISAVLIIGDIHTDLVSIIWGEICEVHNSNRDIFLSISFIAIPEDVVEKMNEYMRSQKDWYKPYEIPSYEYFTYRKINTAQIIAESPTPKSKGLLRGIVTDLYENVLPGVIITVTGSSLIGKRFASADRNGEFWISNLPVGIYQAKAELEGYKTHIFENIPIKIGISEGVHMVMQMGSLEELVYVTAGVPVVDLRKAAGSTSPSSKELELGLNIGIDDDGDIRVMITVGWYFLADILSLEARMIGIGGSGNVNLNLPIKRIIPFTTIGLGISFNGEPMWDIGGGIKMKLTDKLSIRMEYLYFRNSDIRGHVISGGISYFF